MNDKRGSLWRLWDLHFHTPVSFDYSDKGLSPAFAVESLTNAGIEVVAVTDHHMLDKAYILGMRAAANDKLTILPGMELSTNLGGDEGVHFIAIFPEDSDLDYLHDQLMVSLKIAQKCEEGIAEERLYVEFPDAAKVIQDLHGIVTIHGHGKAANFETITSRLKFKQQQKTDLLRGYVDVIEVGGKENARTYEEKIYPKIGFRLPLIVCSDNHDAKVYTTNVRCWIKADPTFLGLKMALREPTTRFFLGDRPPSVNRIDKNKTRYIRSIEFRKLESMPTGEEWMHGEILLNPGLVAIIGNKGSGKSALTDSIGLLGSCSTSDAFSFLDGKHFRDPKAGRALHMKAIMQWLDGEPISRPLSDSIGADEQERVKYLPQSFVEQVCNELSMPGGGAFEQQLKKVIFSKVALPERLEKRSLDELVGYRTQELRRAAGSAAVSLNDLAIERAALEEKLDPTYRNGLLNKIRQRNEEIKSHEAIKPISVAPPSSDPNLSPEISAQLLKLKELGGAQTILMGQIQAGEKTIIDEQVRAAKAQKLIDKLKNLKVEFDRRVDDMTSEALALGLDVKTLASLSLNVGVVEGIMSEALTKKDAANKQLNDPAPVGLKAVKAMNEELMRAMQDTLDRPNREYQAYAESLSRWQAGLDQLNGSPEMSESRIGLEAELAGLEIVPAQIATIQNSQEKIAQEIFDSRVQEANVYSELYGPVQAFIAEHPLAKDQLKLQFKVELLQEGFVDNLIAHLNQNRVGTFYGTESGRAMALSLASSMNLSSWSSVKEFLGRVIEFLHEDQRTEPRETVSIANQMGKGKTVKDLYSWLYSLDYVAPRYRLQWDGKDIWQLSPGERGTLLLIFYLLIDDSHVPLVIDQPEANLDNITVAQKLVDCIRDARDRRQVIIVTHNPNMAVVCDADQLIHATMDRLNGNAMTYECGALENPKMNRFALDVLEGGKKPFDIRGKTYKVSEE